MSSKTFPKTLKTPFQPKIEYVIDSESEIVSKQVSTPTKIYCYEVMIMINKGTFLAHLAHNECICYMELSNYEYFEVLELVDEDIICGLITIEALNVVQIAIFLNLIKNRRKHLIETKISDELIEKYISKSLLILGDLQLYSYFTENICKTHLLVAQFFNHKKLIEYITETYKPTDEKTEENDNYLKLPRNMSQLTGKFKFNSIFELSDLINIMNCCTEKDLGDKFLLSGTLSRIILHSDKIRLNTERHSC